MRIEYHRTLIADHVRNQAFYEALKRVIVPGKSVVGDIGAGTGLLGVMASKLGAREVFLFETAGVASVAQDVIQKNKARNCHLIPCHSTEFTDDLSCDVLVSETLGNYALEENIIATLNDARARFFKRDGIVIPNRIVQCVAPVISSRYYDELAVWDRVGFDIDMSPARSLTFNNVYVRQFSSADLMDMPNAVVQWDDVDLTGFGKSRRRGTIDWQMAKACKIFGFAVWWQATLHEDIVISTAPGAPETHWEQLYFPLAAPIEANSGDRIEANLRSESSEKQGTHLAWTAIHFDPQGQQVSRHKHDLDQGYLP